MCNDNSTVKRPEGESVRKERIIISTWWGRLGKHPHRRGYIY